MEAEVVAVDLATAIGRGILYDYDLVVGVILGEDRIEVALYAKVYVVVVASHYKAHRELFLYR